MSTPAASDAATPAVCKGIVYATRDNQPLKGDLYLPAGEGPFPAVLAAPGGGWAVCDPSGLKSWGEFLARHGIATFAFQYRVSPFEKSFPKPVLDVLDAIRFVRRSALDLKIDPGRIGLLGSSAGAHVSALAALGADAPVFAGSDLSIDEVRVKTFAGVYGAYDLFAHWQQEIGDAPNASQRRSECSLGVAPYADRQIYFDASPLSHVRFSGNKLPVFLAWGTADTVVAPQTQSVPFLRALKQAGFMVHGCPVEGAGHFWFMDEPVEEVGSYSAFLAPRLLRFLQRYL